MKDYSRYSDPFANPRFINPCDPDPLSLGFGGGCPSKATKRAEAQRARSHVALLLQAAQRNQDDDKAVAVAFREAERLRRQLGMTWGGLIAERGT